MTQASVPTPSIRLVSFACPICGAHSTQSWFKARLEACGTKEPVPPVPTREFVDALELKMQAVQEKAARAPIEKAMSHLKKMLLGEPFIGDDKDTLFGSPSLCNVFISRCYTCGKLAIWLHDRLLYPSALTAPPPNPDLSDEVCRDYEEARKILDLSPRGAAALLRLSIEKMCIELKAEGKDLNQRIAFLITRGLPAEVGQALDAVRVIGNEAVHPGQIDLHDDHETVTKLFNLVNFIAEDRISRPKQITEVFAMIPEGKRKGIEKRDGKTEGSGGCK